MPKYNTELAVDKTGKAGTGIKEYKEVIDRFNKGEVSDIANTGNAGEAGGVGSIGGFENIVQETPETTPINTPVETTPTGTTTTVANTAGTTTGTTAGTTSATPATTTGTTTEPRTTEANTGSLSDISQGISDIVAGTENKYDENQGGKTDSADTENTGTGTTSANTLDQWTALLGTGQTGVEDLGELPEVNPNPTVTETEGGETGEHGTRPDNPFLHEKYVVKNVQGTTPETEGEGEGEGTTTGTTIEDFYNQLKTINENKYGNAETSAIKKLYDMVEAGGYTDEQKAAMLEGTKQTLQQELDSQLKQAQASAYARGLGQSSVLDRTQAELYNNFNTALAQASSDIESKSADALQTAITQIQEGASAEENAAIAWASLSSEQQQSAAELAYKYKELAQNGELTQAQLAEMIREFDLEYADESEDEKKSLWSVIIGAIGSLAGAALGALI